MLYSVTPCINRRNTPDRVPDVLLGGVKQEGGQPRSAPTTGQKRSLIHSLEMFVSLCKPHAHWHGRGEHVTGAGTSGSGALREHARYVLRSAVPRSAICNTRQGGSVWAINHTFGAETPSVMWAQPRISSWKSFHSPPWRSQYWRRVRPFFSPSNTSPKVATMVSSVSRQCRYDVSLICTRLPCA